MYKVINTYMYIYVHTHVNLQLYVCADLDLCQHIAGEAHLNSVLCSKAGLLILESV